MSALLEKLGVPRNVRLFFKPYFSIQCDGSLLFRFGDEFEHFGIGLHRVPTAIHPWIAGDGPLLFYGFSAMEAIAFLSLNHQRFPDLRSLRFVATGNFLAKPPIFPFQKCSLLFGNDLTGRLTDIRYSLYLKHKIGTLAYQAGKVRFALSATTFMLAEYSVSLYAFEKAAGLRSGIRTYKPPQPYDTFLQQIIQRYENDPLPSL